MEIFLDTANISFSNFETLTIPTWIDGQLQNAQWGVFVNAGGSNAPLIGFDLMPSVSGGSVGIYLADFLAHMSDAAILGEIKTKGLGTFQASQVNGYAFDGLDLGSEFFPEDNSGQLNQAYYSYTISSYSMLQNPLTPSVTDQTANQTWTEGQALSFQLPSNTFTDPQNETLTYSATLSSGAALPSWLSFNPSTRTFSGTVPVTSENLTIEVTATDTSGLSATETFTATVVAAVAPTVSVQNVAVAENTAISASAMIAGVSNPSGDTVVEYIFEDQGGNGHFIFNGTIEPDGIAFFVPVGSLSAVQYAAGTSPGADSISIELGYETPGATTTLFSSPSSLTATTWLSGDFNGGSDSDLLWQNQNGTPAIWEMNGTTIIGAAALPDPGPSWQIIATGDFNGDGKSDILFQNTNGTPTIWEMNGATIINAAQLPDPGPSWQIIGTGDFNGDGKADILFQNTNGTPAIWEMNGTAITDAAGLFDPGPSWHVVGAGDFNGDGDADILLQNANGTPVIWEMSGTTIIDAVALPNPGPSWHIIGTGDFTGNGEADILFQNTNGQPAIWEMNGTTITDAFGLPNPGPSWQIIGTGDLNGDGKSDILFQNTNGTPAIWEMNGATIINAAGLANPLQGWHLINPA